MGYRAYPDYKSSGVEWFRAIPSGWMVHRLKMLASEPLKYGANEAADLEDPNLPRFIRITDVNSDGSLNPDTFRSLPEKTAEPFLLEDGDILLARSGATVGKSFIYSPEWGKAAYAGYLIRLRTNKHALHKRFAYYFFQSSPYWASIDSELIQATIQNFSAEKYSAICIPTPGLDDQVAAVQFLDHKTAQIDRLIEKKQELIEKLQEQRTATITQAVTKGLVSDVTIKESNNQWFDSIPAHWQVIRLKDLVVDAIAGPYGSSLTKAMYTNSGYRVYGQQQVIPEDFSIGDYYISDEKYEEMQRYRTLPGDILISVMGTIGRAALVPDGAEPGIINPRLVLYRANERIIRPGYLKNFINSRPSQSYFSLVAQGTTMEGINMALIGELSVAVPPLSEQDGILLAQQTRTARLEKQAESVTNAIERLQEYRTALITAAVTGQIDVRDWRAPEPTKVPAADKEVA